MTFREALADATRKRGYSEEDISAKMAWADAMFIKTKGKERFERFIQAPYNESDPTDKMILTEFCSMIDKCTQDMN